MSSRKSPEVFQLSPSRCNLDGVLKEKPKLLTVKLPLSVLAEFAAVAQIRSARSVSEYTHRFVVQSIEEARKQVGNEAFNEIAEQKKADIEQRSKQKAAERRRAEMTAQTGTLGRGVKLL